MTFKPIGITLCSAWLAVSACKPRHSSNLSSEDSPACFDISTRLGYTGINYPENFLPIALVNFSDTNQYIENSFPGTDPHRYFARAYSARTQLDIAVGLNTVSIRHGDGNWEDLAIAPEITIEHLWLAPSHNYISLLLKQSNRYFIRSYLTEDLASRKVTEISAINLNTRPGQGLFNKNRIDIALGDVTQERGFTLRHSYLYNSSLIYTEAGKIKATQASLPSNQDSAGIIDGLNYAASQLNLRIGQVAPLSASAFIVIGSQLRPGSREPVLTLFSYTAGSAFRRLIDLNDIGTTTPQIFTTAPTQDGRLRIAIQRSTLNKKTTNLSLFQIRPDGSNFGVLGDLDLNSGYDNEPVVSLANDSEGQPTVIVRSEQRAIKIDLQKLSTGANLNLTGATSMSSSSLVSAAYDDLSKIILMSFADGRLMASDLCGSIQQTVTINSGTKSQRLTALYNLIYVPGQGSSPAFVFGTDATGTAMYRAPLNLSANASSNDLIGSPTQLLSLESPLSIYRLRYEPETLQNPTPYCYIEGKQGWSYSFDCAAYNIQDQFSALTKGIPHEGLSNSTISSVFSYVYPNINNDPRTSKLNLINDDHGLIIYNNQPIPSDSPFTITEVHTRGQSPKFENWCKAQRDSSFHALYGVFGQTLARILFTRERKLVGPTPIANSENIGINRCYTGFDDGKYTHLILGAQGSGVLSLMTVDSGNISGDGKISANNPIILTKPVGAQTVLPVDAFHARFAIGKSYELPLILSTYGNGQVHLQIWPQIFSISF